MEIRQTPEIRSITLLALLFFTSPTTLFAADRSGTIKGTIVDGATKRPLPGANLAVMDQSIGAIATDDGRFVVTDVPVGLHRLQVSMIGYDSVIRPDVVVRSNRITSVDIELTQRALGMGETVVVADYFSKIEEEAVSAVTTRRFAALRDRPAISAGFCRRCRAST